jgi:hypothetical protein
VITLIIASEAKQPSNALADIVWIASSPRFSQ